MHIFQKIEPQSYSCRNCGKEFKGVKGKVNTTICGCPGMEGARDYFVFPPERNIYILLKYPTGGGYMEELPVGDNNEERRREKGEKREEIGEKERKG